VSTGPGRGARGAHRLLDADVVATACGPIEVATIGAGPVVILVHGMPGSWRQAVPLAVDLAASHTVLLPSRPGYGRTPRNTGRTPREQAAAYAALLDAIGIESAAIVGISGGGPSAAAFAVDHAHRTTALVLCCALAPHLMTPPLAMRRLLGVPGVAEAGAVVDRRLRRRQMSDPAAVERRFQRELTAAEAARAGDDERVRGDLVGFLWSHLDAPAGMAGMRNDIASMGFAPRGPAPELGAIRAPTAVLHGDTDRVVPIAHGRFYADAIPGATLEVFPGAGHAFILTYRAESTMLIERAVRATSTR
jgi:pimeloyl-ACP methyl ester carboxylesterase